MFTYYCELLKSSKKSHQREDVINYKVANEGKSRQTLQALPLMGSTGQTVCTELLKAVKKTTNKGQHIDESEPGVLSRKRFERRH